MASSTNLNPSTREPLSEQLRQINLNQENLIRIFEAIRAAVTGTSAFAQAQVTDVNGNQVSISIPSNTYLYKEVKRISENIDTLAGLNIGGASIIDSSSNSRRIVISSLLRSLPGNLDAITKNEFARIDISSAIHDLMYPCPKIEFNLPPEFDTDKVVVKKIKLNSTEDLDKFNEGIDLVSVRQMCERNAIAYSEHTTTYNVDIQTDNYYGSFNVLSISHESNGDEVCVLDKLTYNDVRTLKNTRSLAVGDLLCDKKGVGMFKIIDINDVKMSVTLRLVTGVNQLSSGIRTLWYQYDAQPTKVVAVPIMGGERSLVFIAPVNPVSNATDGYSGAFKIDTSTLYIVNANSAQVLFDTWFNSTVINIGTYLQSVAEDQQIPLSMGIKPDKPVLDAGSFQVVQINKHITDTSDVDRIKKLATEKEQTFAKITTLNKRIAEVNTRINTGRYRSTNDKNDDQNLLQSLINEREQQTAVYTSLINDITSKTQNSESLSYDPKFRIRGFWAIQNPIDSPFTRAQHIIHYRVEYRYLNARENVANSDAIKYFENGQYVSGLISSWNELPTNYLRRERSLSGLYQWSNNNPESDEVISINQCDIPIKPNESVEIRVKACSEAGYPQTMVESEWSDILRIDFPAELLREQSLEQTITDNQADKKKIEVEQLLKEKGILEHIQLQFVENGRFFAHSAHYIASGFYTEEQTNISLYEMLQKLQTQFNTLNAQINGAESQILVDIVDASGVVYNVKKSGTTQIFAGYYCDDVDPESANAGTIISKPLYIRLRNLTSNPVQITSRYPGVTGKILSTTDYQDANRYENVPYVFANDATKMNQYLAQILYSKNKDISGNTQLVVDPTTMEVNEPGTYAVAANQIEAIAMIVRNNQFNYVKASNTENNFLKLVGVSKRAWEELGENEAKTLAQKALRYNSTILRDDYSQAEWKSTYLPDGTHIEPLFNPNDKFLIGTNTCGARLVVNPASKDFIQVNGSNQEAYFEVLPGEENAVFIPIMFQYRMCDALGNYGSDISLHEQTSSANFKYLKKMNIELFINKKVFEFDLEVYSQFRQVTTSMHDLPSVTQSAIQNAVNPADNTNPSFQ